MTFSLVASGPAMGDGHSASVTPASLTFASQAVGTTSASQTVTLTSTGNSSLSITAITITGANRGDFHQTSDCGSTLDSGASCAINVTFTPSASGTRTGTISISDNAGGSPQTVALSGTGTQADPLGTATDTVITCPPGGVGGKNTCYSLTITCPSVANITATLKVTSPSNGSVGTVIFGTGGGGNAFYDQLYNFGSVTINSVVNAGFIAAQINFDGLPTGWLTGPGGVRKLACRYATAAQWIYDNIHQANTAKPLCATGQSGGASAVAYSLAHYGLDSILAMVEPTSGPPMSRIDYGCICNQPSKLTPCNATPLSECYGSAAAQFIDPAYSSDICSDAGATHDLTNQALFYSDSVASADALLSYPKTDVHVVFGGQDTSSAVPLGLEWIALITTKNTVDCVADAPHEIPDVLDGAQKIASDLINYCHLQ